MIESTLVGGCELNVLDSLCSYVGTRPWLLNGHCGTPFEVVWNVYK